MRARSAHTSSAEDKKQVLTKALINMTQKLDLSRQEISSIIGPSESSLCRIFAGSAFIDPDTKEGQLTILLIRAYQNLDTLFGGNEQQCQLWLRSDNHHLSGIPVDLIQTIEGLVITVEYLDTMRSKN